MEAVPDLNLGEEQEHILKGRWLDERRKVVEEESWKVEMIVR